MFYYYYVGGGWRSIALSVRGVEVVGYPPTWHMFHAADDNLAYGLSWWLVFRASLFGNSLWSSVGSFLLNCRTWQPCPCFDHSSCWVAATAAPVFNIIIYYRYRGP